MKNNVMKSILCTLIAILMLIGLSHNVAYTAEQEEVTLCILPCGEVSD